MLIGVILAAVVLPAGQQATQRSASPKQVSTISMLDVAILRAGRSLEQADGATAFVTSAGRNTGFGGMTQSTWLHRRRGRRGDSARTACPGAGRHGRSRRPVAPARRHERHRQSYRGRRDELTVATPPGASGGLGPACAGE